MLIGEVPVEREPDIRYLAVNGLVKTLYGIIACRYLHECFIQLGKANKLQLNMEVPETNPIQTQLTPGDTKCFQFA